MHSIRLRGPWEFSIRGSGVSGRIDFPCTWQQLGDTAGSIGESIELTRRFNKPTGLEAGDGIWLSLRYPAGTLSAQLNGTSLLLVGQPDGSWRAETTTLLADRNELTVELAPPSPALLPSIPAVVEAALEIHSGRRSDDGG